ncbi:hypothetical protein GGR39_003241 [Novosphingobium fluoreni]|uniref:Uncharacterized protein n=1 Tax=Novosphingobium fluoreni TaxID=1391222 RepID=A0A7W6C8K0_9SPHN|nr:hypothetical protein [Novosphingobium fluoreni]MBB3941561.1 hypothetical protein [Novosphingobium fluoreni]
MPDDKATDLSESLRDKVFYLLAKKRGTLLCEQKLFVGVPGNVALCSQAAYCGGMSSNAPSWLKRFTFDRVDRGPFELRLDRYVDQISDDEVRLAETLDYMCRAITEEYRVRRALGKNHTQYRSPRKWLKPVCYNAILTCMHLDVIKELAERQERYGRFKRGPKTKRSIFDDALKGIFAHEGPPTAQQLRDPNRPELSKGRELLDRKDRERLANEMQWGFRHYAEPSELNGFNRAFPLHRKNSADPRDVAPKLYRQVVKRRILFRFWYSSGETEHYRGRYSDRLENDAESLGLRFERLAHQCRIRLAFANRISNDDDDDDDDDDGVVSYEDDEHGENLFTQRDDAVEFGDDDTWVEDD